MKPLFPLRLVDRFSRLRIKGGAIDCLVAISELAASPFCWCFGACFSACLGAYLKISLSSFPVLVHSMIIPDLRDRWFS